MTTPTIESAGSTRAPERQSSGPSSVGRSDAQAIDAQRTTTTAAVQALAVFSGARSIRRHAALAALPAQVTPFSTHGALQASGSRHLAALRRHLSPAVPMDLATLQAGDAAHHFEASAIYLDASDQPMGARFVHSPTGFQLDLLLIDAVPQSYTWVKSFPTSNQGEPHTQEHLLVTRGLRGRTLDTMWSMSLARSSAFTQQWRTSYVFDTNAGFDTFFDLYAEQQRALLHPDYSDAEIRLEVRNFGVTKGKDGTLRLQEKGPVYNEMVTYMATCSGQTVLAMNHAVYGEHHPLGYEAGGAPSGIRTMTPEDIRRFHDDNYHLANMGTVAAFHPSATLDNLLERFDHVLSKDASSGVPRPADSFDTLPPPAGDPEGAFRIYEYPHSDAQEPSQLMVVWPATRDLDVFNQVLAGLFFRNVAGLPGTNLYTLLIDSRSRTLDTGATRVSMEVPKWGGHPISIRIHNVRPAAMSDEGLRALRKTVVDEIQRVATFADGSSDLKAFNERIRSKVLGWERELVKVLGEPPRFGAGGLQATTWPNLLLNLERLPEPRKSLVTKSEFDRVRALLDSGRNFWREALERWKISGVTPYVVGARPSPELLARDKADSQARLSEKTEQLKQRYKTADAQQALAEYAADKAAELASIEDAVRVPPMRFVESPPLTLDDKLQYESVILPNGVPLVASHFDVMPGAMTGIALRLDGVPREQLRYLSLMPALLTGVGAIIDGHPLSVEDMYQSLAREILTFGATFSPNELVLRASGVDLKESRSALDWMERVLYAPDWRPDNLPRIRDVVKEQLAGLRKTTQGKPASWAKTLATAWRQQRDPVWLATHSLLTRAHNALRLRWQLMDPIGDDGQAWASFLERLAETGGALDRQRLKELLAAEGTPGWDALSSQQQEQAAETLGRLGWGGLSAAQRSLAAKVLPDLELKLAEMPDSSIGEDFSQLTLTLRDDLAMPPSEALAQLDATRRGLLRAGGARMFLAASAQTHGGLDARIKRFAQKLDSAAFKPVPTDTEGLISMRLRLRGAEASPVHLGLHVPHMKGGVVMTWAPFTSYADWKDTDQVLDFLAACLYGGTGSHSVFAKTNAAGLAYNNGIARLTSQGRLTYYAERNSNLTQTMRFVVGTIKDSKPDPALVEYVMAQAFSASRASQSYEDRAIGIADDLAHGPKPELVSKFRSAILELRRDPDLMDKLAARKDRVHARILAGYAPNAVSAAGSGSFVIGPSEQLDAWAQYLKEVDGDDMRFQLLYERDFWT